MINEKKKGIKYIKNQNKVFAIILQSDFSRETETIEFFTPGDFSQQLGYMNRPKNYVIEPHLHNQINREVHLTNEVLFIKSGKVRVDFYDQHKQYFESYILNKGDIILLVLGGHGFEMLEKSEIIEVKQGPYAGDKDKVRFDPIEDSAINIKD
jgi:mannose-6-phosphate isomerase-like protein (cupin superfamily)